MIVAITIPRPTEGFNVKKMHGKPYFVVWCIHMEIETPKNLNTTSPITDLVVTGSNSESTFLLVFQTKVVQKELLCKYGSYIILMDGKVLLL